mmetsp:Transcript_23542/g.81939  ORF Transcript_23542/g.81939 Transcript_23542/m.81939 type:complete len:415 (-) Transcript_23542:38-1282(-)
MMLRRRGLRGRSNGAGPAPVLGRGKSWGLADFAAQLWEEREMSVDVMCDAAERGSLLEVKDALAEGISVEAKGQDGYRALHRAAMGGSRLVVMTLIEVHGAEVDSLDADECTPLHVAARDDKADACRALLELGANIEARNCAGNTPLHCAAANGCRAAMEVLFAAGADVHARNTGEWTPLYIAAFNSRIECIDMLAAQGADVNVKTKRGDTAMHRFAALGNLAGIRCLFAHGADACTRNNRGQTAYFAATDADQPAAAALVEAAIRAANEDARRRRQGADADSPFSAGGDPSTPSTESRSPSPERERFRALLFSEDIPEPSLLARGGAGAGAALDHVLSPHERRELSRAEKWLLRTTADEMGLGLEEVKAHRRRERRRRKATEARSAKRRQEEAVSRERGGGSRGGGTPSRSKR